MVSRSAEGAEGTPFEIVVEQGKIAEFARAVQAHDLAEHHGADAVSPPTFLTTQFFWEERVDGANPWSLVEMSQERGMHAEQAYVFHGPPPQAGERLVATSRVTRMWDKESRSAGTLTFVEMVTEFRDAAGTLRATATLTGVETGKPPEVA
ncbi:MAG: MaoC family dehydratase N-terminal domain-containing protein [Alphaproteobacteria bacterium]|nr:MaoC family dehydratase N-terminal domain-containing protein [Alphaproteobacteria bacterium]